MPEPNAYLLFLDVRKQVTLDVGMLRRSLLPAGRYIYVGSARNGAGSRINRHRRLARHETGKLHWHIDYLLVRPEIRLAGSMALTGSKECEVSQQIAVQAGVAVPIPGFGASDCRAGCKAHLYLVPKTIRIPAVQSATEHPENRESSAANREKCRRRKRNG